MDKYLNLIFNTLSSVHYQVAGLNKLRPPDKWTDFAFINIDRSLSVKFVLLSSGQIKYIYSEIKLNMFIPKCLVEKI